MSGIVLNVKNIKKQRNKCKYIKYTKYPFNLGTLNSDNAFKKI